MKKVIFVGGTEFSGSTFFHMILANDAHGLAIGEAHNMMRPSRSYHFNMHCSCGEHPCSLWQSLKDEGEESLYSSLFSRFPDAEFIVDSSKNPFWIQDQKAILRRQGIDTKDIVVWKTPYEFATSYQKRGNMQAWERSWIIYHQIYNSIFERWHSIPYHDLTSDRRALEAVCNYLDIPYFDGKERYWERAHHHVVGGNPSARVHLYSGSSADFEENVRRSSSKIDVIGDETHRSIYYDAKIDPLVKEFVDSRIKANEQIPAIFELLQALDVRGESVSQGVDEAISQKVKMPRYLIELRKVKYWAVRYWANMRYGLN
jgi:hypothetical protein